MKRGRKARGLRFFRDHLRRETAFMQLNVDGGINYNRAGRPNYLSLRRQANCIASFEHSQGAERVQCMRNPSESLMPFLQPLVHGIRQPLFAEFNSVRSHPKEPARPSELLDAKREVIHTLCHPSYTRLRNNETAASGLRCHEMP